MAHNLMSKDESGERIELLLADPAGDEEDCAHVFVSVGRDDTTALVVLTARSLTKQVRIIASVREPENVEQVATHDPEGNDPASGTAVGDVVEDMAKDPAGRLGVAAGLVTFFAVGCPVCNKLVLLALGASGAVTWFAPLQPILAVASVVVMAIALRLRLRGERSCRIDA